MKWAYNISHKMRFAIFLASVFLIIFAVNRMDKNNVESLGISFSEVYEDRLLVESYIYHISDNLYRKKIAIDNCYNESNLSRLDTLLFQYNNIIGGYLAAYDKTKLTELESEVFTRFKKQMVLLSDLENQYIHSTDYPDLNRTDKLKVSLDESFNLASEQLKKLSGIQVAIGKDLNDNSQKIVAGSSILTQFELGILLVIAIIMQVFIFASKTLSSATPQQSKWN